MATIGTFTSNGNGFTGTVRTLALNAKAKLVRVENPSDKGPHFRIFAGNVELGAAWQKTAKDTERDYLSVKLGRPELPGSDLRHPDRGGRPGRLPAHLVPPQPGLRTPRRPAPPKRRGRFRVLAECKCRHRSAKHRCASGTRTGARRSLPEYLARPREDHSNVVVTEFPVTNGK